MSLPEANVDHLALMNIAVSVNSFEQPIAIGLSLHQRASQRNAASVSPSAVP
jgi:hypothetical protein